MKKLKIFCLIALFSGTLLFVSIPKTTVNAKAGEAMYRSCYVVDYDTGTVIEKANENDRYPIASMVKIMTLLLAFEEIDAGNLDINEKIIVSDYAAGMGGSQLFLDAGKEYPITDLLKGITVCSANDCAVAIGERIAGSNDSFVEKMNKRAKELNMENTLFCNATGLPDSGEQYSSAKDVTIMMRNLLSHPKYYDYTKITLEDYVHPDGRVTQMVNTNKLLRSSIGCDAGKTGFTNEAMFCLSASAKRGETRVIATVLGCPDSKTRFRKVSELFSYAFGNYETKIYLRKGEPISCNIEIPNGKNAITEVVCDKDIAYFGKKGADTFTLSADFDANITAPVADRTAVGRVTLVDEEGKVVSTGTLYSTCEVEKKTFYDNLLRIIENRHLIH